MDMHVTLNQLHQLVEAYNSRRLSMADYRLARRQLLTELDTHVNGVQAPEPTETDLITIRKNP